MLFKAYAATLTMPLHDISTVAIQDLFVCKDCVNVSVARLAKNCSWSLAVLKSWVIIVQCFQSSHAFVREVYLRSL